MFHRNYPLLFLMQVFVNFLTLLKLYFNHALDKTKQITDKVVEYFVHTPDIEAEILDRIHNAIPTKFQQEIKTAGIQAYNGAKIIAKTPPYIFEFLQNKDSNLLTKQTLVNNGKFIGSVLTYNFFLRPILRYILPARVEAGIDLLISAYWIKVLINKMINNAFNNITATKINTKKPELESINCKHSTKKKIEANAMSLPYYIGNTLAVKIIANSLPYGASGIFRLFATSLVEGMALAEYNYSELCFKDRNNKFNELYAYYLGIGLAMNAIETTMAYMVMGNRNILGVRSSISMLMYPLYIMTIKHFQDPKNLPKMNYPIDFTALPRENVKYIVKKTIKNIIPRLEKNDKKLLNFFKKAISNPYVDYAIKAIIEERLASNKFFSNPPQKLLRDTMELRPEKIEKAIKTFTVARKVLGYIPEQLLYLIPSQIIDSTSLSLIMKLSKKDIIIDILYKFKDLLQISYDIDNEPVVITYKDAYNALKFINSFYKITKEYSPDIKKLKTTIVVIEDHFRIDPFFKSKAVNWSRLPNLIEDYFKKSMIIKNNHTIDSKIDIKTNLSNSVVVNKKFLFLIEKDTKLKTKEKSENISSLIIDDYCSNKDRTNSNNFNSDLPIEITIDLNNNESKESSNKHKKTLN